MKENVKHRVQDDFDKRRIVHLLPTTHSDLFLAYAGDEDVIVLGREAYTDEEFVDRILEEISYIQLMEDSQRSDMEECFLHYMTLIDMDTDPSEWAERVIYDWSDLILDPSEFVCRMGDFGTLDSHQKDYTWIVHVSTMPLYNPEAKSNREMKQAYWKRLAMLL